MNNTQIAEILRRVAAAHQYKDEKKYKFQIIAYNRAADAVEHSTSELKDLWDDGKLDELPSIGKSIASHLDELFKKGKSQHFDEIMKGIPEDAFILMALPKVGLKTAMKMIKELPKDEVKKKVDEANKILNKTKRLLLPYAEEIAFEVMEWMKKCPEVVKMDVLGSLRRKVATIGDIDIAVAVKGKVNEFETKKAKNKINPVLKDAEKVIKHFTKYPKLQKIIESGDKTASILLPAEVQVDILVTGVDNYGNSLQHFTGSKFHNIALREYSLKQNLSMNEFRVLNTKNNKEYKFKSEEELYSFYGMDYIEPELREGVGEVKLAQQNTQSKSEGLPKLVTIEDIKADFHIHSNFDIETSHDLGINSMAEIVQKADSLGYEYIALSEHNPSKKGHTAGEMVEILKRKREIVDELNKSIKGLKNIKIVKRVFNSLEIDINKDGTLTVPEEGLQTLDFALVSIHSSFDMNRSDMTKRVLTALSHPKVKVFAHPTARKLNEREGVELDWDQIFDFVVKNNKWIEINADPMRLDLPDSLVREAIKLDVKLTLGTDTHSIDMMDNMRYGVYVARRGWAENKDIVNAYSLDEFQKML